MRKVLLAAMALALVAALVGAGTYAYFTDTQYSTLNVFTAGTLDLQLRGGTQNGDDVIGTWTSPAGWKPGDIVSGTLECNNKGSVDAKHIYFYFQNLSHDGKGDGSNLMNAIIVKTLKERFNAVTTGNQASTIEEQLHSMGGANGDGILTLAEFAGWAAGYYTIDDQSGDGIVIAGGNQWDYDLIIEFEFDPNAGDLYQGDTCQFDLKLVATQNSPTDGMIKLHQ